MKKSNIFSSRNNRKIDPKWFTNKVNMKDISTEIKSPDHGIYHVYFHNGAKTKLHMHNGNQILIATKGKGALEIFKKLGSKKNNFKIKKVETISLKEGDTVHIPAKTLHTHGSVDKNRFFSHVAINISPRKNSEYKTTWYESDFKSNVTDVI